MKKKLILILAIVLIIIIGAGTAVATYAVWDSKQSDLSIGFTTGNDLNITVNMEKVDAVKNFRPNSPLANNDSSNEVIVRKFNLSLKVYSGVTFTVGDIYLKESNKSDDQKIVANAFMAATIYEGDQISADKIVAKDGILKANTTYIVTFKFTVDSDSDLLTTNMQRAEISTEINFKGYNGSEQGGNA